MRKLIIEGEMPLHGEVTIQGAKNAAQKILPATVVFPGTYLLRNVPLIQDTQVLIEILTFLGADVAFLDTHTLCINTVNMTTKEIPPEVTAKSTGTFLFAGALLSRFGEAKIWHPGGDKIGKRPVTWHLTAFQKLGASISEQPAYYEVCAKKLVGNCTIPFLRPTANGTVNAVIAAARAQGKTVIENVAPEPEIANFVQFMQAVGAKVSWCGTHQICVNGVEQGLGAGEIEMIPDRNDAATFLIASALGHGPVTLSPLRTDHLLPVLDVLKQCGVQFAVHDQGANQSLTLQCDEFHPVSLHLVSRPYPGFSTDWGPMMQVLLSQLPGTSTFHETIFSRRFAHINELVKMGATIHLLDLPLKEGTYNFDPLEGSSHAVQIQGPRKLTGTVVNANDVRAGAALVLAGLAAKGVTEVTGIEQIERGYEHFAERLNQIGASIRNL